METSTPLVGQHIHHGPHHITNNESITSIIEDDQQLYDWGIENRLDQYYQNSNGQVPPPPPSSAGSYNSPQSMDNNPGYVISNIGNFSNNCPINNEHSLNSPQKLQECQTNNLPYANFQNDKMMSFKGKITIKEEPVSYYLDNSSPHSQLSSSIPRCKPTGRKPSLPQVDMDENEILKVERKRARNRLAASKCRLRKIERIAILDKQASQLRSENEELVQLADKLRQQLNDLKEKLNWHIKNGCNIIDESSLSSSSSSSENTNNTTSPDSTTTNKSAKSNKINSTKNDILNES